MSEVVSMNLICVAVVILFWHFIYSEVGARSQLRHASSWKQVGVVELKRIGCGFRAAIVASRPKNNY